MNRKHKQSLCLPQVVPQSVLWIRLFGRPCITGEAPSGNRPLKYRKGVALLAYLALHAGRWHSRDALAELLWPELKTPAARTNLRQVLADLRQAINLTPQLTPLRANAEHVSLVAEPAVRIDALLLEEGQTFPFNPESLTAPFLEGFDATGLPVFEEWLHTTRQHLANCGAAFLERQIRHHRDKGELAAALERAEQLHAAYPLEENYALWVMTLLFETGQRRAALAFYTHFSNRLGREMDALPGAALTQLRDRIETEEEGHQPLPLQFDERCWVSVLYGLPESMSGDEQGLCPISIDMAMTVATQWGGLLYPAMGQGFLMVFGMGADSERSVERALQAALAMKAHQKRLRCGLARGRVEVYANGPIPHLIGPPPDLATELGWMAEPGEIRLTESMALLAGPGWVFQPLGPHLSKVAGQSLSLFHLEAMAAEPLPVDLNAQDTPKPTPVFIGREAVLAPLLALWEPCCKGNPHIALVKAAAGLGKTTLALEFARQVEQTGARVIRQRCRLAWQHQPLTPVKRLLAHMLNSPLDAPKNTLHAALLAHLEREHPTLDKASQAAILSLFLPKQELGNTTPKDVLFAALITVFGAFFAKAPVLWLLDDLHWCDHTTLEWLGLLLRSLSTQPVMCLLTFRPGVSLGYPEARTTLLELSPMPPTEAQAMVAAQDCLGLITPAQRERILADCGGIPLFIERLVKTYLEGGHHQQSIDELLQAELWHLGTARQVICAAAVWGEEFSLTQLQAIVPNSELRPALSAAQGARLVLPIGPERFRFAHALIRDAAYAGLPKERAQHLHKAAAQALIARHAPAQAIAQHAALGHDWTQAALFWTKAAEQAMASEFVADAQYGFTQALYCLEQEGRDEAGLLEARIRLGRAAQLAEGFGSALAYTQFGLALRHLEATQAEGPKAKEAVFTALSGCYMGGSSQGAVEGLNIAWRLAKRAQTPPEHLTANFALGNSLFWKGHLHAARDWQERGVALAKTLTPQERTAFCVDDPAITCRAFLGWTLWFLGDSEGACRVAAEGVAQARASRRVHALCFALTFASAVHWSLEDDAAVRRLSSEALGLSRQHGFPLWESVNSLFLLWVLARQKQLNDTTPLFEAAIAMRRAYAAGITTSRWIALHALLAHGGEAANEAESLVDLTITEADDNEDQYCLADLLWQKAVCLQRRGEHSEAKKFRRRARDLARKQKALGLLARFTRTPARGSSTH